MFSAVAHKNLADAESYFDEHLAQNDYYAAGEIRPGQWIGTGAERLVLSGQVTREQFHALCENLNPETSERLTQRQQKEDKRRVFYDFTCSAPKSVSVLAVTLDDERLVKHTRKRCALRSVNSKPSPQLGSASMAIIVTV
jgi:conjugative relaxase-like TrwC/TraI family protein